MAEVAVRDMLKEIAAKTLAARGHCMLSASDFMDDGSCIQLTVNINPTEVCRISLITSCSSKSWYCTQRVCLCVHQQAKK